MLNHYIIPRVLTISLEEAKYVSTKHNFSEVFDIPEFTGEDMHFERDQQGNFKTSSATEARIGLRKKRTKGKAKKTIMEKCGLAASSETWEFAEVFFPFSNTNNSNQADKKHYFSF